jgi:2-keto-4-pentenoate hydratase/2-oxohepta-3-ene-1,7-dioic acid hydratase in catechol pathway
MADKPRRMIGVQANCCLGENVMKLVRFGPAGREKPGILDADGHIRDLSKVVPDIAGEALTPSGFAKIRKANLKRLPLVRGKPRLGPCVGRVRNFIAIGLNYADHAAEAGMPLPKEPIIFNKAPSCICGPNDNTVIPKDSNKLDYEVELGIVIGTRARYLERDKAMRAVAGYFLSNDVSERTFQIERSGGQWNKGKGCETFGPIGPWLVTRDEIKDPQNLDMWLTVNGETRQKGNTRTMVFGVEHLVWYCSQFFVMEPGDIIITGTPPGVAMGMKPPKFLQAGDVVRLGMTGLGEQTQKVVALKK